MFALFKRCLRIIQVEFRCLCHSKYIPCFRIHHDGQDSVRAGLLLNLCYGFFCIMLNDLIYGSYYTVTVFRLIVLFFPVRKSVSTVIGIVDPSSCHTAQICIIFKFKSRKSCIIICNSTQSMCCESSQRITSLSIFSYFDPCKLLFSQPFSYFVSSIFIYTFLYPNYALLFGHQFLDFIVVHLQSFGQDLCNVFHSRLTLLLGFRRFDITRSCPYSITSDTYSQFMSVSVIYNTSFGFYRGISRLLLYSLS